jgi:polyisoprenoid-binding protein YceI
VPRFEIDPARSRVWIEARSSVHPIRSTTDGLTGHLDLNLTFDGRVDPEGASGRVSLPVERLRTGHAIEDRELRKRIDATRYPSIDGELGLMTPSVGDDRYSVAGDVTFLGVTQPHHGEMTVRVDPGGSLHLAGEARFDVRQFGLQPPRLLMLKVEPEVTVRVEIVAMPSVAG